MKKATRTRVLFLLYALFLILLLFCRGSRGIDGYSYWESLKSNINLIPFHSIRNEIYLLIRRTNPYLIGYAVTNLFGNVLLFIPLGLFLPLCFRRMRRFGKTFATGVTLVLFAELLQLLTLRGSFDIDDIILNTLGIAVGYGVFGLIKRNKKGKR